MQYITKEQIKDLPIKENDDIVICGPIITNKTTGQQWAVKG